MLSPGTPDRGGSRWEKDGQTYERASGSKDSVRHREREPVDGGHTHGMCRGGG